MSLVSRLTAIAFPPPPPRFQRVPRQAKGVPDRSNAKIRTIVVRVDQATFDRINAGAVASGVSTTEALRQLIARGLDAGGT